MSRVALVSLSTAAFVFSLHVATADAQHGHSASPHAATAPHAAAPTQSHGGAPHASTTHGSTSHGSTHGTSTHGNSHASATHGSHTTTKSSAHQTTKASSKTTTKTATTTTKKTASTTTSTSTTPTPVQQKLVKNTNLASKLQSRLPAGTDLQAAAAGFRNLGQFVAAVNVSHNLGIPFADLKKDMVTRHMSLGQSIQDLRPTASATIEAEHADYDARVLITETESTTTTTGTDHARTRNTATPVKPRSKPRSQHGSGAE